MLNCMQARYSITVAKLLTTCVLLGLAQDESAAAVLKSSTASSPLFRPEDFVIVINTDHERLKLAHASRPLRVGIRTFIAVDKINLVESLNENGIAHNETYAFFPNRNITGPERDKPGDTRWQVAPFMAHHHYGPTYKWMLLGDDDTLWFMLGVKRLLYGYESDLPYAISDHFGDHNPRGFFVPSPLAAVCSPCHWPDLLRAKGLGLLMKRSSPVVSEREAAGWEPRDLDGWGLGRLRMQTCLNGSSGGGGGGCGKGRWRGRVWGQGGWGRRLWSSDQEGAAADRDRSLLAVAQESGSGGGQEEASSALQHAKRQLALGQGASQARGMLQSGSDSGLAWQPGSRQHARAPINVTALLDIAYYGLLGPYGTHGRGSDPGYSPILKPAPPIPPPGCPCRPVEACLHRARLCRGAGRGQELCGRSLAFKIGFRGNRTWCRYSWAHGGAGVVLSVGLMRAAAGGPVEECARTTHLHSCDMNLALCLMQGGEEGEGGGGAVVGGGSAADGSSHSGASADGNGSGGNRSVGLGGGSGSPGGAGTSGAGAGGVGGGFMFTHPGSAVLHGAHWADPRFILFDNPVFPGMLHNPVGFLKGRVVCGSEARAAATAAAAAMVVGSGQESEEDEEEGPEEGQGEEQDEGQGEGNAYDGGTAATRGGQVGEVDVGEVEVVAEVGGGGAARTYMVEEGEEGRGGGIVGDGAADRALHEAVRRRQLAGNGEVSREASGMDEYGSGKQDGRSMLDERGRARGGTSGVLRGGGVKGYGGLWRLLGEGGDSASVEDGADVDFDDVGAPVGEKGSGGGDGMGQDQAICEWLVRHAVSLHMHGRKYPSHDAAADAMSSVVRQHLRAVRLLRKMQQQH